MRRLRGARALLHDAIEKTTSLVERTHRAETERYVAPLSKLPSVGPVIRAVDDVRGVGAGMVYASIRLGNRAVRALGDAGERLWLTAEGESSARLRSDAMGSAAWWADHVEGVLNGFVGDHLDATGNGLSVGLGLRHDGEPLAVERVALAGAHPSPSRKLAVFVHGLSCTEWSWAHKAEALHGDASTTFGALLERDLGYSSLFVRYNSGRHVSDNGAALSALLDALVREWPGGVDEIALVGHSMGGLVSRSAAEQGADGDASWARALTHVVCLGSPHLGAPLEKAGNLLSRVLRTFDHAGARVPAEVLDARSAGIKDLRFGYTREDEWKGHDPDAFFEDRRREARMLPGVRYAFVAGTLTDDPAHPVGRVLGDMMVRTESASGGAPGAARRVPFDIGHVQGGIDHLTLQNHPDVYARVRDFLAGASTEG